VNGAVVVVMMAGFLPVEQRVPDPVCAVIDEPAGCHHDGVMQQRDDEDDGSNASAHGRRLSK
jgi:hypothetical protein